MFLLTLSDDHGKKLKELQVQTIQIEDGLTVYNNRNCQNLLQEARKNSAWVEVQKSNGTVVGSVFDFEDIVKHINVSI